MRANEILTEMPQVASYTDYYLPIKMNIEEKIDDDYYSVIKLGNNLRKIIGPETVYYWYELNGVINLGIEIDTKYSGQYRIRLVGKLKNSKDIFAEQLYVAIFDDIKSQNSDNILMSDEKVTMSGFKIWLKLLNLGNVIKIYDTDNNIILNDQISTGEDLKNFYGETEKFKRWRFILGG